MAAVGRYESVYEERSAGSRRGRRPAGADIDEGIWGRGEVGERRPLVAMSCAPPARLPMVVDCGSGGGRGGSDSTGGPSRGLLCEGVPLRDETCVTVGDTAASKSVPAHLTECSVHGPGPKLLGHCRRTWIACRRRHGRGRVLVPDHVATATIRQPCPKPPVAARVQSVAAARLYCIARDCARRLDVSWARVLERQT